MSEKSIIEKHLRVTMPDGSKFDVPIRVIARDRADSYKGEYSGDLAESLMQDTIPFFEEDHSEIYDWSANNMNWEDVANLAVKVPDAEIKIVDYQEGWVNGEKEIV